MASPRLVTSSLLAGRPAQRLHAVKDAAGLVEVLQVAEAVPFILSRPRNVTNHDMIVLPTNCTEP